MTKNPLKIFSPPTIPSTSCGHDPDEGVVNVTFRLSNLFSPVISQHHAPLQSTLFHNLQPLLRPLHHHHNSLLNNHSFCSTLFNICQITFFSPYAPCVTFKKSYALCNSSTILPHALNQDNNALCFPLPSPHANKSKTTHTSMPMLLRSSPHVHHALLLPLPTEMDAILHHHFPTTSSWLLTFKTSYNKHDLDCADAIPNGRVML